MVSGFMVEGGSGADMQTCFRAAYSGSRSLWSRALEFMVSGLMVEICGVYD